MSGAMLVPNAEESFRILQTPRDLTKEEAIDGCGAGKGEQCCAFLLANTAGEAVFTCGRGSPATQVLTQRAVFHRQNARRLPTEVYPQCQRDFKQQERAA
jgi:hypothetical protein